MRRLPFEAKFEVLAAEQQLTALVELLYEKKQRLLAATLIRKPNAAR